jgi:hypothetical protein
MNGYHPAPDGSGYWDDWGDFYRFDRPAVPENVGPHEPGHFDHMAQQAQTPARPATRHGTPRVTRKRPSVPPITDEQARGLLARLRKSPTTPNA